MNNNLGFRFMSNTVKNTINKNTRNKNTRNKITRNKITNTYSKNNMKWGTVTWKLFHWMAANINEEFYQKSPGQLHGIIKNILYNLPCPTCKQHAIEFLNKYDIAKVKNKSQLIQYFYFFHNKVNDRKNIMNPDRSILDSYSNMNGVPIINDWNNNFKNNLGINLNDFMNKQNIAVAKGNMMRFIKNNRQHFSNL